uniref:G_PROTEIN_RECEP_F1_2 domain-containing protein n=1 Tax=Mesocestoides corti TaxID=53468 RepID=A0A5K3FKD1_MESCO
MCCLFLCVTNLAEDSTPYGISSNNVIFNVLVCVLWKSRFFYWIFTVAAIECLVFFSIDRAILMQKPDLYQFTSEKRRIIYFEVTIHVFSVLITAPQILTVNNQDGGCSCAPTTVNIPFLALIYAHVYLWFSLLFVLDSTLLLLAASQVILWVREMSTKNHVDELNTMWYKDLSKSEEQRLRHIRGWRTASMCIVPMALSQVLTFLYDSTYQFLSAVGATTFIINSPQQKVGGLLLVVHANVVPCCLLIWIPALRGVVCSALSKVHVLPPSKCPRGEDVF